MNEAVKHLAQQAKANDAPRMAILVGLPDGRGAWVELDLTAADFTLAFNTFGPRFYEPAHAQLRQQLRLK